MKKYYFRIKNYLLYIFTSLGVVILGYFFAPKIMNFPPYTEDVSFQQKVESLTHLQQYTMMFLLFVFVSIISITILYKDIFKLIEKGELSSPINKIREKCFSIPDKLMIIQIVTVFFMSGSTYMITPEITIVSWIKMIIFYVTLISCGAVISTFFTSEWLRQFVIWSYKEETDFSFQFTNSSYENHMLRKILPLIIIIYIITTFFAYSLTIKEIGNRGYEYYKNELSRIDLDNLMMEDIISQLERVPLWKQGNSYFYSVGDTFKSSNNEQVSIFFTEYTKGFIEKTDGHIYDFFGVEQEGYAKTVKTYDGKTIYVGFIYQTTDATLLILVGTILSFSILVSIIYLRLLLESTSRDIKLIMHKLKNIAAEEKIDYSEKIPISTNNELGEIIAAYNKIQSLNRDYVYQLDLARERADRANSAKTDFLSNMSHEIRTPLNAIVGFSQALADENISEGAREEVNDIIMSSNNLLEIVNGILDISKIEANKLEVVCVEYDSNILLKEVISLANARLASKPLDFKISIDPDLPQVLYGDRLRIKQVVLNLLTNAIKYTKEGYFSLTISSIINNDTCRLIIAVEDSGVGIKPEDIDKLFSKFQRFELEKNVTTEGTGLGLAITKSLVELMGGKIIVQSIYGEGSKFTLFIDQMIVPKTAEELQEQIVENTTPFNAAGQRILVVDDNKVNLKVANRLLRDYHTDVDLVLSGQECLDKVLNGEKYDLILMDDMMPRMSGTDALKNLRNIINFDTPIVALTANAIAGMRERYLSLGFDEYLAKPIDKDLLHHVLKRFLRENSNGESSPALEFTQEIDLITSDGGVIYRNQDFLEQNGVNYHIGLELLGDLETYEMTMIDFYEEAALKLEQLNKHRDNADMQNYAIAVHSLKSDSKYLGFTKLAELAYDHEMASKDSNCEYVDEHYDELIEEINRIIEVVKQYLGK